MLTDLPPVGPERDRLVAEALGNPYVRFDRVRLNGEWVDGETWIPARLCEHLPPGHLPAGGYVGMGPPHVSTSNHAAYDALEAAVESGVIAGYAILRNMENQQPFQVEVWNKDNGVIERAAPTLGDAASRAIILAKRREG